MVKTVNVCCAILEIEGANISATKLRGYMGHVFADIPEFHHHMEKPYHYPLIQYKRLASGKYMVMGLDKYAEILPNKMRDIENIVTKNQKLPIQALRISQDKVSIDNIRPVQYYFSTPWIALNKQNYEKFLILKHKKAFLQDILVGNIISAYKGLDIHIDFPVMTEIIHFKQRNVIVHENNFVAFYCKFRTNISLIQFMGLGKSVSKGFGIIQKTP